MLLEDQHFYTLIEQRQTEDGFVESTIKLNEQHPIYKGHFPQQAVVPGVCMMQLIAELTSKALKQALSIQKAQQAKFLIPIVPDISPELTVNINYKKTVAGPLKVSGSIESDIGIFFKFKGLLA